MKPPSEPIAFKQLTPEAVKYATLEGRYPEVLAATRKAVEEMAERAAKACENLTRAQIESLLIQMLLSEDFQRLVRVDDNAQTIVYLPYERAERLQEQVDSLERRIVEMRNALSDIATKAHATLDEWSK